MKYIKLDEAEEEDYEVTTNPIYFNVPAQTWMTPTPSYVAMQEVLALQIKEYKNGNGENSMNGSQSLETNQRQYLKERATRTLQEKLSDLQTQFGLADEKAPTTAKEFFERIKEGRYTLPEKITESTFVYPYSIVEHICWRDPAVQKDREGYEKASKLLNDEFTKVKDAVMIKHLDDALTAVTDFDDYPA